MNYTINEIPDEAVELSGTEMIPIWQGETKKVSVATLAGYVQDASSYSTTETLTGGKWIDGKPIYRKVILNPTMNTTLLTGVDEVVNYRVKRQCLIGISQGYVYYEGDPANGVNTTIYINLANNEVKINNIHAESFFNAQWVLLEYTKTTD